MFEEVYKKVVSYAMVCDGSMDCDLASRTGYQKSGCCVTTCVGDVCKRQSFEFVVNGRLDGPM